MTRRQTTTADPEQLMADADELRADADRLAREAAEAFSLVQQAAAADAARAAERQADADRHLIESYSRAKLDDAVEQARRDLDQIVRDSPITQALARYLAAQVRRSVAVQDLLAARSRLGMPTAGASLPPVAHEQGPEEVILRAASQLAAEMNAADQAHTEESDQ